MPIKSYIVTPLDGDLATLRREVLRIPGCDAIAAKNQNVLIVVTDTCDEMDDDSVHQQLQAIPTLQHITLVSGFQE